MWLNATSLALLLFAVIVIVLKIGAKALVAVYTGHGPDVFVLLRQLEIRSESYLNFIYNPF